MKLRLIALATLALLGGCRKSGDLLDSGIGVYSVRSSCPVVGIPLGTGDVTLFGPLGAQDSRSIDVTASITNLRGGCTEGNPDNLSVATFDIVARRTDSSAARQVILPYFDVVLQGGETVVAKRIGQAVLQFAAGQARASIRLQASARVNRSVATLPETVRRELTRERKPGEQEAAVDPLADPAIRAAVAQASFEHLVGFQLTEQQLRYNATR